MGRVLGLCGRRSAFAVWMALGASLAMAAATAMASEFGAEEETSVAGKIIGTIIDVVITTVWYWLGSKMFRRQPTIVNCLIAAIIPPVLMFFIGIALGIVVSALACINIYLGILVAAVALIYLLFLYVKWVDQILELESTGIAFLLVIIPRIIAIIIAVSLGEFVLPEAE